MKLLKTGEPLVSSSKGKTKFLIEFNTITINPILLTPSPRTRIYTTTLNFSRHLLTNYTLLDNYRALNLVNNKKLLVLSSFVKLISNKYIKVGTS